MTTAHRPGRTPYRLLFGEIDKVVKSIPEFAGDPFLIMAISVRASMGVPWFCKCDSLYTANLREINRFHGDSVARSFVSAVTVKGGPNAGRIPKFKYVHSWYQENKLRDDLAGIYPEQLVKLSCAYGYAQKPAIRFHSDKGTDTWRLAVDQLIRDPSLQLMTLAYDLFKHGAFDGPLEGAALFDYMKLNSPKRIDGYVPQIQSLRDELRGFYEQATLNLNEVSVKSP